MTAVAGYFRVAPGERESCAIVVEADDRAPCVLRVTGRALIAEFGAMRIGMAGEATPVESEIGAIEILHLDSGPSSGRYSIRLVTLCAFENCVLTFEW